MNKNYFKSLGEIQNMIGSVRTIKEAVDFNDNLDGDVKNAEEPAADAAPAPADAEAEPAAPAADTTPVAPAPEVPAEEKPSDEEALANMDEVDTIRELCLKGMVKRCHNVEDPGYDALKKILQLCDKAMEPSKDDVR